MRYTILHVGILTTMAFTAFADISDLFEDTIGESNRDVLDKVVSNQFAGSVVNAMPASSPQTSYFQAVPANYYPQTGSASYYPQAVPANYPQSVPANYPQAAPANYPQAAPANYPQAAPANFPQVATAYSRPATDNMAQGSSSPDIQYIPYRVPENSISKFKGNGYVNEKEDDDDDEDEDEEDEEEEDEEEEDEEEFDADDLITRRRRRR
ncbi:hypothetical protein BD408DRAFT_426859 [Parasitella parasitica]|nr:hypothetical protein BD408DRAFT_426859 [Parasitella parasitica]